MTRPGDAASAPVSGAASSADAFGDGLAAVVLDTLPDATAVLDVTGRIIAVNHVWRMFALDNGGAQAATGVGVNYLDVCDRSAAQGCGDAAQVAADLRAVLAGDCAEVEVEYPCPSPSVRRWFLLRTNRLIGNNPGAVLSHVNITRRKTAEVEIAHAASHDPLSGLANRRLLGARMSDALKPRPGTSPAADVGLLYIDLDGFKAVNDTFGHAAGDEVLLTVSSRLQDLMRADATLARLGGDEFAILTVRTDLDGLTALATRVRESLAEPHRVHGQKVSVGGSVGLHLATAGDDATQALERADQAMYLAKQRGRDAAGLPGGRR